MVKITAFAQYGQRFASRLAGATRGTAITFLRIKPPKVQPMPVLSQTR